AEAGVGDGWRTGGGARRSDRAAWVGHGRRERFTYGSRWPHPRRRYGVAGPAVRAFVRQRCGIRDGHGGWRGRSGEPDRERRSLLGTAWWRRQLRRRHRLRVPPPRGRNLGADYRAVLSDRRCWPGAPHLA